ncbi:DUF664 domain-containing protein [Brevibacterium sp. 5221]|uniref:DUF664 domain-containing protein n=1 Tax=Brevibacterium rongguiense TaxID=2695267 RepID=A0A6N9H5W7_9MICO|nr:DUF664 domain-containing protein [Brevibacterium rongguiense]MYM19323.1 DUF664 domain-containing protein [Brevibacterium rongguiense]
MTAEPGNSQDVRELLLDYFEFYRRTVEEKVRGLQPSELYASQLPSGWTPAGLVNHLAHMERRWFRWAFLAEQIDDPFGDREGGVRAGPMVNPDQDIDDLLAALHAAGADSRAIVRAHALDEWAAPGGRFADADSVAQLHWIMLHVLQEYARHAGHLDIACELRAANRGDTGEA